MNKTKIRFNFSIIVIVVLIMLLLCSISTFFFSPNKVFALTSTGSAVQVGNGAELYDKTSSSINKLVVNDLQNKLFKDIDNPINYIKNYVKNSGSNKTHISNFIKGVSKISKYGNKFKKAYSKKKIFPTILALLSAYESVATGTAVGAIVALLTAWNVTSTWIDCTLNIYYGEYQCYIASRSAKPLKRLP